MENGSLNIDFIISLDYSEYKDACREIIKFFSEIKKERPDVAVHIEARIAG